MRLVELARLLPYYWWQKSTVSSNALERIEEIMTKVANGENLAPEDELFLFGDSSHAPEAPVYARFLAPIAHQMDELDAAFEEVRRSRDLDSAWGWVLDLLAGNVGVMRPRNFYAPGALSDVWMRELVRLFVYCHTIHGARDELLTALAWFIGIAHRKPRTEILPQLELREVHVTRLTPTREPLYLELRLPWKLLALYANDHFYVANTDNLPQGQGFWVEDTERGFDAGLWDGHHLLTDLLTFARSIVPVGTRLEIFGTGFYIANTDDYSQGQGFWVPDTENGFDVGRWPGLLEDGAIEPMHPGDYEQLRIAPYSYAAVQKELVNFRIRYQDGKVS
jgi:hypothetical protein